MNAVRRTTPPGQPADTAVGLEMFLVFSAAALIATGAVALLAVVRSWWMLGLALAIHVGMTVIVTATIVDAMRDGDPLYRRVRPKVRTHQNRTICPRDREQ